MGTSGKANLAVRLVDLELRESEEMKGSKTKLHLPGHDQEMRRGRRGRRKNEGSGQEHVVNT